MNTNFNLTVTLSPEDIKNAIAAYVRKEFSDGHMVSHTDVTLNVSSVIEGYGLQEHSVCRLTDATVKVNKLGAYQDR